MRVWDYHPRLLCNKHLIAQHNEIHAIHSIITNGLDGFSNHPEVKRWVGKLGALYRTHERTTAEMLVRGYNHNSELPYATLSHLTPMPKPWQSMVDQLTILVGKQKTYLWCDCAERIIFSGVGNESRIV